MLHASDMFSPMFPPVWAAFGAKKRKSPGSCIICTEEHNENKLNYKYSSLV